MNPAHSPVDTTVMEYTAEDLIAHKLQRGGILVAKPKFDRDGADLLGLLNVKDGAKFCRIQCKGRSLVRSDRSHVDVFTDYVSDAFILFLFVETGDSAMTYLFAFFGSEIEKTWDKTKRNGREVYSLSITRSKLDGEWEPYRFTDSRLNNVNELITRANASQEFAHVFYRAGGHLTLPGLKISGKAISSAPPLK